MKKSNIKRILSGVFAMLMVCCIAFTTQGLTVNAAIVSGGKKNYSYKELKTDLKQLQKKYRDHCQVNVIGKTADKRNLYEVVIGNPNAKKHLLVIGNLHAREHMTVQLCMKQIEYYLNNSFSELRIILRRWPNDAFTTFTNSASSQPSRPVIQMEQPLVRRDLTLFVIKVLEMV